VIRVEREIDVARSASEVYDRLIDIEQLPRWQPAVSEAALESPPPIAVGSRIRIVADVGGQRTVAAGTITELDRPSRIGLVAKAGSADVSGSVRITPAGADACRVRVGTTINLGGMLRFVEGVARSRIEAEAPSAAAAVKAWLESDAVPAAASANADDGQTTGR
jgi:carbon monoxide dehydrogenase subunit G